MILFNPSSHCANFLPLTLSAASWRDNRLKWRRNEQIKEYTGNMVSTARHCVHLADTALDKLLIFLCLTSSSRLQKTEKDTAFLWCKLLFFLLLFLHFNGLLVSTKWRQYLVVLYFFLFSSSDQADFS